MATRQTIQPTVLCVDDEIPGLVARKMVLERHGYRVLVAHGPAAALDLYASNDVALVLTDHLLKGLTGMQIAAEMKRLKPHVPIIVISGLTAGLRQSSATRTIQIVRNLLLAIPEQIC